MVSRSCGCHGHAVIWWRVSRLDIICLKTLVGYFTRNRLPLISMRSSFLKHIYNRRFANISLFEGT